MTEVQDEAPVETGEQGGDPRILVRSFDVQVEMADERTIDVRVVPFNEVATVADPPSFRPYREQFVHQVFGRNEKAANRVLLRAGFGHDGLTKSGYRKPGLGGVVGHGIELKSREGDGYFARFKMHSGTEADTARELVRDGVLTGVSPEFVPIQNNRTKDNILQRVKAHLDSVLLTYIPAYSQAQVLAMREETVDQELMPPLVNRELLERCAKLGVSLPEGMAVLLNEDEDEEEEDSQS
jgi:HK97 family phage prohead protease